MGEAIIQACAVEKYYPQPDGNRIEVVARPIWKCVGQDCRPAGTFRLGQIDTSAHAQGPVETFLGPRPVARQADGGQIPNVAIVFQSGFFPWLTVLENVEAPLVAKGIGAIERHKRALKMIDTVGLNGFETAYPEELSGGMKQRVGSRARWWSNRKCSSWTSRSPR